jgi:hypothetical protein
LILIKESLNEWMLANFKALWGQAVKEFDENLKKDSS